MFSEDFRKYRLTTRAIVAGALMAVLSFALILIVFRPAQAELLENILLLIVGAISTNLGTAINGLFEKYEDQNQQSNGSEGRGVAARSWRPDIDYPQERQQ